MTEIISEARPPLPPFTQETATEKVRKAENAWNTKSPRTVALAYSPESKWRNRSEFICGRDEITDFLIRKWKVEQGYKLVKEIWAFGDDRIAVRFAYEWHNDRFDWFRSYGNENWKFNDQGLMTERHASINDISIGNEDRLFLWEGDLRPDDFPSLSELGI